MGLELPGSFMKSLKTMTRMEGCALDLSLLLFKPNSGQTIFAVDRAGLNKELLDELESRDNVKFFFNHRLGGADFINKKAWFEVLKGRKTKGPNKSHNEEVEVQFDLLIGADGAHSAARFHMMKYTRVNYQQEYIDTLWCEFQIPAQDVSGLEKSKFRISPNHLHIWPGKEYMFIAIPSLVRPPFLHILFLI